MKTIFAVLILSILVSAQSVINGSRGFPVPNDTSFGTTLNGTATISALGAAVKATTSNIQVPTYIVISGAGLSGNGTLASVGLLAVCTMDATVSSSAGAYYVINSQIANGQCHAQSAAPAAGTWVIGFLASSSTTAGSAALVAVDSFILGGTGGGGSMTYPLVTGIPEVGAGAAWGSTYNAGNTIPANFLANIAESQVTSLSTDLGNKVATTVTVNTHPLSANVTVSASDLTTGTLPHAQLPALVSGDVPSNAANTSGNAATATALATLPTKCTSGQAPTGVLANGNATGCAATAMPSGLDRK